MQVLGFALALAIVRISASHSNKCIPKKKRKLMSEGHFFFIFFLHVDLKVDLLFQTGNSQQ